MPHLRWTCIFILALGLPACGTTVSNWDPLAMEPGRPELPGHVDSNDAHSVYQYAESRLERAPAEAAQAFYWASRLDPLWADPLYARRMAHFLTMPGIYLDYVYERRGTLRSPGIAKLDSLYVQALRTNPFLHAKYDVQAFKLALMQEVERSIRLQPGGANVDMSAVEYYLNTELSQASLPVRAWMAESEGHFSAARDLYLSAIERDSDAASLHIGLARVQFRLGMYDAARASFGTAIELLRDREDEELVRLYNSKVLLEHSIGLILEEQESAAGAREAYARALQEDISYSPAHLRLAELALASGDTATAVNEYALAASIDPQNGGVAYLHGALLARVGDVRSASVELRRAIEFEPHFAAPYLLLAAVLDEQGQSAEAAEHYRAYLERSPRHATAERAAVEQRLRELESTGVAGAEVP